MQKPVGHQSRVTSLLGFLGLWLGSVIGKREETKGTQRQACGGMSSGGVKFMISIAGDENQGI